MFFTGCVYSIFFLLFVFLSFYGLGFMKMVIYLEFMYFVLVFLMLFSLVFSLDMVFLVMVFSAAEGVAFFSLVMNFDKFLYHEDVFMI